MRLTVTVVSPGTGQQADVMIDADPGTAVAQLAAELDGVMHGGVRTAGPAAPALFVGWHQVPGDMRLADSPILDGSVVSIADPAGCLRPEPAGWPRSGWRADLRQARYTGCRSGRLTSAARGLAVLPPLQRRTS
jgi:hypothetical protein